MTECAVISRRKRYDYRQCHKCVDCGKERLINYKRGEPESQRCHSCAAKLSHKLNPSWRMWNTGGENPNWKGGRYVGKNGYAYIRVPLTSPFAKMRGRHTHALEHRFVLAQHLGRCLHKSEIVHHKNGNKSDNRVENLELVSHLENLIFEKQCAHCELRKEIRLLQWQIKELTKQLQGSLSE